MKLVGFVQIYNEMEKGNLPRFLDSVSKYCDELSVYDDASTDESCDYLEYFLASDTRLKKINLIRGQTNEWGKEAEKINLWRSDNFYRLDNSYNDGWFCRLWRNIPDIHIENKPGLHQRLVPPNLGPEGQSDLQILHYGFASDQAILRKYNDYKAQGQKGWALDRLVNEIGLRVEQSDSKWFNYIVETKSLQEVYKEPLRGKI